MEVAVLVRALDQEEVHLRALEERLGLEGGICPLEGRHRRHQGRVRARPDRYRLEVLVDVRMTPHEQEQHSDHEDPDDDQHPDSDRVIAVVRGGSADTTPADTTPAADPTPPPTPQPPPPPPHPPP